MKFYRLTLKFISDVSVKQLVNVKHRDERDTLFFSGLDQQTQTSVNLWKLCEVPLSTRNAEPVHALAETTAHVPVMLHRKWK